MQTVNTCHWSTSLVVMTIIHLADSGSNLLPQLKPPLQYREFLPYKHETSEDASGPAKGRIYRDSPEFRDLVINNSSIIMFFEDDDRIMSKRMHVKLNVLAVYVRNAWPDEQVFLQVKEAWNASGIHSPDSLHPEGRAVDIATSDLDQDKLGILTRLCVEVGFDWAFYESKNRVHCSVKSDDTTGFGHLMLVSSENRPLPQLSLILLTFALAITTAADLSNFTI